MDDNSIMPFGKYKGEKMANVPASYLLWIYDEPFCTGELKKYIKENMDAILIETKQ